MSSISLIGGACYCYVTSLLYSTNKCRFVADPVQVKGFFPYVTVFALKSHGIPGAVMTR